ncbi:unnamed protein product [Rotaria sp. Silwood2]|nr:unnamed protein product [Rotaria sp. Silwood2]CAF3289898.1 unnamed protein product [Rotaria sp. Silwood2]CAF4176490.1 unnamed protein product [Rotaria sp. Silwood2]CAF4190054.1 unnamed protein product [Rotaria sp. Silwood2]
MSRSIVHLLDLPNEVLLIILRQLNNIDVLYSLLDINNGRLDILAREKTFTNILNFVPVFMKRILLATVYPNLTELKLFNFEQQIVLKYFTDESSLRSVFQQQITNLILVNNDKSEKGRNRIIDGTCVQNDILVYLSQLHSFAFYISTYIDIRDLSREDIQQTLINIGQQDATSIVSYISTYTVACSIFSLPFAFDYLVDLGNIFSNIVFSYVTYLVVQDNDAFRYEFFVRIARSFPLLKYLRIFNIESQLLADLLTLSTDHSQSYSMVEYSYLTSLDVAYSHKDYLEQFLNETKAYVPCLTELRVCHRYLKIVTENFTREATRCNCAKVNQLIIIQLLDNSEDHSHYFPSL